MNQSSRQLVCHQCGATRAVTQNESRRNSVCHACGAELIESPLTVPVALPVEDAPAPHPHPVVAQPIDQPHSSPQTEPLADPQSDAVASQDDEAYEEVDEQYGSGWISENAVIILAATGLLAVAGVVLGLAWGGFQFGPSQGIEDPNVGADQGPKLIVAPATLVDASRKSVRRNGVKVKIVSASYDRLWTKNATRQVGRSEQTLMTVRLRITNQEETHREFSGWRAGSGAALDDSNGGEYEALSFDEWASVQGASDNTELPSGVVVEDIVVFRPLVSVNVGEIEWLRVRLPAAAYGGVGDYYFEIPASMIDGPTDDPPPPNWLEEPPSSN